MHFFGLRLLGRPGPTYDPDAEMTGWTRPVGDLSLFMYRPGVIGVPVTASKCTHVVVDSRLGDQSVASQGVRYVSPRSLTAEERDRFTTVVKSLRLVPASRPSEDDEAEQEENPTEIILEGSQTVERTGPWVPALTVITQVEAEVRNNY